jgi:hypothetical protein
MADTALTDDLVAEHDPERVERCPIGRKVPPFAPAA